MSKFKDNLKEMRKRRGYTQKMLSDKSGLSSQMISNFEREYTQPNQEQIRKLSIGLNCSISDLLDADVQIDYEKIMFSDKSTFDKLPKSEKARILNSLQEQADFMVERAKKNNQPQ